MQSNPHKMDLKPNIPVFEKFGPMKAYKCHHCNRMYSTQVHGNIITGRIPLLMPCSHSLCEDCLTKMIRTKNIACKVCECEVPLDEDLKKLHNLFPVDRYMFGALLNQNSSDPFAKQKFNFARDRTENTLCPYLPSGCTQTQKPRHSIKVRDKCSQPDCIKPAEWRCASCGELYCSKCDTKIHESIRILRSHTRYPIDIADLAELNVSCCTHSDSVAEYACNDCASMLCSKCMIKEHAGHNFDSLEDKNAKELDSLKEYVQKATYLIQNIECTQKMTNAASSRRDRRQTQDGIKFGDNAPAPRMDAMPVAAPMPMPMPMNIPASIDGQYDIRR